VLHPQAVPAGWDDWQGTVDPSTYRYYGFTLNQNGRLHRFGPDDYQTEVEARLGSLAIRRESRRHRPFFLDLAFLAPHAVQRETSGLDPIDPIDQRAVGRARRRHGIRFPVAEARDEGRFATVPLPDLEAFDEADVSDKPLGISTRTALTPRAWVAVVRNYRLRLEALMSVDRAVARIVRTLAETRHLDDTYLVFVSDNGFLHGEHRVPFGKFLPYEPSIRVPLVIRGPGVRRGVHRDALTTDVDLPATILDLAHARAPRVLDGRSLVPLLEQAHPRWARRDVLLESGANPVAAPVYTGLRTQRFKYVEYENGERELYDLRRDPDELTNVAGTRALQTVERRLAARLATVRGCVGRRCP
jgi:membrane-anchored protein YejM (alkaline phosphatase superfamily)